MSFTAIESSPFILNRFRQLLGKTNHWQTGPGPRGGWAWWWSSPWSLCQGLSAERWRTWADINIHDKQMPSVMQRMVLNKINNQSINVEICSSLYILWKYFCSSTINFCCCYCDGCVHGSERHLTDAGASENPGLWAPAPGLSVPQQTRDNKNMANTEQLKSRGTILLWTLIWKEHFKTISNCNERLALILFSIESLLVIEDP